MPTQRKRDRRDYQKPQSEKGKSVVHILEDLAAAGIKRRAAAAVKSPVSRFSGSLRAKRERWEPGTATAATSSSEFRIIIAPHRELHFLLWLAQWKKDRNGAEGDEMP